MATSNDTAGVRSENPAPYRIDRPLPPLPSREVLVGRVGSQRALLGRALAILELASDSLESSGARLNEEAPVFSIDRQCTALQVVRNMQGEIDEPLAESHLPAPAEAREVANG